jgi:hypothetical protein
MLRRWLIIAGCVLALGVIFGCGLATGFVAGMQGASLRAYHTRYLEEREAVEPLLRADPTFAGVELCERSNGGIYLLGDVPTQSDLERLRSLVTRALGEPRSREALQSVSVKKS